MQTKYIFVTGGVVSGLGKGITAASLGKLLKARGYKVTIQKFDPYINIDPGTMSPCQHGEVFVTEDGGETDLDIGHYERFIDDNLTINSNTTAGKIYWAVLNKERKGEFSGATIQVIPHITNSIKERIYHAGKASRSDIVITEVGGTVGDIESLPFLEAIRQTTREVGRENVLYIHVTLIPYLPKSGEMKTKPTQHSVKELLSLGIQPDIVVCRTERKISQDMRDKLALFCNVDAHCIVENIDCKFVYEVPLLLETEQLAQTTCQKLKIPCGEANLREWEDIVNRQRAIDSYITIALVGKYVELHDAYLSIAEALRHAGIYHNVLAEIKLINAEEAEHQDVNKLMQGVHGVLIPGGFDNCGIEGKVAVIKYAREHKIPFLGLSLGMQCAVVEFARSVLNLQNANSSEIDENTPYPVINLAPMQTDGQSQGGIMRLGAYPCKLQKGTHSYNCYQEDLVYERHRHRYEFNNQYRNQMVKSGLVIAGQSPDEELVEIIELPKEVHPWFVGVQFHPEFKSRPNRPHPLFKAFMKAACDERNVCN